MYPDVSELYHANVKHIAFISSGITKFHVIAVSFPSVLIPGLLCGIRVFRPLSVVDVTFSTTHKKTIQKTPSKTFVYTA